MNPKLQAALLLPFVAGALTAQDLRLETRVTPTRILAQVEGAAAGALVVLVLGLHEAPNKLPGGQMLGVEPDAVTAIAVADLTGTARIGALLPRDAGEIRCFVQAVAVAPKRPLDAPGGITVSKVASLHSESS